MGCMRWVPDEIGPAPAKDAALLIVPIRDMSLVPTLSR